MAVRTLLFAVLVILALVPAASGGVHGKYAREIARLDEAMRLEAQAIELWKADPLNEEWRQLVTRSMGLLEQIIDDVPDVAATQIEYAYGHDRVTLTDEYRNSVAAYLRQAFAYKFVAKDMLEDDALHETVAGWKDAKPTTVTAPSCRMRFAQARVPLAGCSKTDVWEIYVPAKATKARCRFQGPRGALTPRRPLFAGTVELPSCDVAGYKTVGGERKRVIRAELMIVVPPDVVAKGAQTVRVRALWR